MGLQPPCNSFPVWLGSVQVLHQHVRGGGGLTTLADVADADRGVGGLRVEDQNADVINEQVLTKFIYHN